MRDRLRSTLRDAVPPAMRKTLRRLRGALQPDHTFHEEAHRREFFRRAFVALGFNGISGDYAEFGCYGGATFALAWDESRRAGLDCTLWAFDSFAGLPEPQSGADAHPAWIPGSRVTPVDEFHRICRRNGIDREAYRVVPGYYDQTLTDARAELPRDIGLAYIDCDLHSSTTTVLRFLRDRLKHGMILAFDDYFCWSPTDLSGERRAALEAFPPGGAFQLLPYVQFGWHGMSFVVEDARLLPR